MSYENAPQTKMLATHCAACGRPLCDSVSVETGMGPDCRQKYGYYAEVSEEARKQANKIVYQVALAQTGEQAAVAAFQLSALGFGKLAERILNRIVAIQIEVSGNDYLVSVPYSEENVASMRTVPGQRWDKDLKVRRVPVQHKKALLDVLNRDFRGQTALGPKGVFVVGRSLRMAFKGPSLG